MQIPAGAGADGLAMAGSASSSPGTVAAVHGVIVDVDCPLSRLPKIVHAVAVERPGRAPLTIVRYHVASRLEMPYRTPPTLRPFTERAPELTPLDFTILCVLSESPRPVRGWSRPSRAAPSTGGSSGSRLMAGSSRGVTANAL